MVEASQGTSEIAIQLAQNLCAIFPREAIDAVLAESEGLRAYQDDPVGFCESHFDEFYTDDARETTLPVRD